MDRMKTFGKYAFWGIALYLLTLVFTFIGFNINYKDINFNILTPEQISIEKAEATSSEGRVYGYVSNIKENNINGKYIKIEIYNENNEKDEIQYLKIQDVKYGEKKLFKASFKTDNAKY